jgi:hypothetical protein
MALPRLATENPCKSVKHFYALAGIFSQGTQISITFSRLHFGECNKTAILLHQGSCKVYREIMRRQSSQLRHRDSQRIDTDAADFNGSSVLISGIRSIRWQSNCISQASCTSPVRLCNNPALRGSSVAKSSRPCYNCGTPIPQGQIAALQFRKARWFAIAVDWSKFGELS